MISKILNTFGTRGISAIVNFLIAIAVSQFLGPDGKGEQGIILTTIAFVLVFSNLVGGATLVYLTPRHHFSLLLLPSYLWALLTSALAYIILSLFSIVDPAFVLHICILAILNGFTNIHGTMLIGKEKIKASNLVNLLQPVIVIACLLVFFLLADLRNINAYIYSIYLAFGGSLIASILYMRQAFGRFLLHPAGAYAMITRELFRLGFMNQLAHITQMMSFRLSYYVLEVYHGEASVGIYSNGIQIMESIWLISKSISLVQYARISNTDDPGYARLLSVRLLKAGIYFSMLALLILVLLPESFYLQLFGEGFSGIKKVIWILAPGVLIYNFSIILGHYFSGLGKYYVNTIASTLGLIVSIALLYLLIPAHMTAGAALASSISYLTTSLVVIIFFMREAGLPARDYLPGKDDVSLLKQLFRK